MRASGRGPEPGGLRLLCLLAAAGCVEATVPTAPETSTLFTCLVGDALALEPGQVAQASGGEAGSLCLAAPGEASEYVFVPFFASSVGTANLDVEVAAGGSTGPAGPEARRDAPFGGAAAAAGERDRAFHHRLRLRERRELTPLIPTARASRAGSAERAAREGRSRPPQVGDFLLLNTTAICDLEDVHTGRVEAVGEHAVIVADVENPSGGFGEEDWNAFAAAMDTLVWPVETTAFGEPTDIDANGRSIVFFTRAVNELTPPDATSFVAGFFWSGDLFPRQPALGLQGCPGSNETEMFYMVVPDPFGEVGRRHTIESVRRFAVAVIGHEFQHLINASRRLYVNDAGTFEEVWLNEGLSHIAEELLFYAASGLGPRQNLDTEALTETDEIREAFLSFAAPDVRNYGRYLTATEDEALLGVANLPTRGASWSFLRYAADRTGDDDGFFFDLVNATEAGVDNLNAVLGTDALDWMQDWSVSVYTDDAGLPVEPRYLQPSWNFRSVVPALLVQTGFPLRVGDLPSMEESRFHLDAGGASYLGFGLLPSSRAVLEVTSGDAPPPAGLRTSVVRVR